MRVIAVLVAALPFLAPGKDEMASLRPKVIEQIGCFCYTGIVTQVGPLGFTLDEQNGHSHYIYVYDKFEIQEGDAITVEGERIRMESGKRESARRIHRLGIHNRLRLRRRLSRNSCAKISSTE